MTLIKTRARGLKLDDNFAFTGTVSGAGGVTMADQWRLTGAYDVPNSTTTITGWSQVSGRGFGALGSSMTQSSGVFTFPSTGIYLIMSNAYIYRSSASCDFAGILLQTSTDSGSNFLTASESYGNVDNGANEHSEATCSFQFDVTNTSTHKVQFRSSASDNNACRFGGGNSNQTHATFIRLGDT
jgi:hypothetical protein